MLKSKPIQALDPYTGEVTESGIGLGIDKQGSYRVQLASGEEVALVSGEVRIRYENP